MIDKFNFSFPTEIAFGDDVLNDRPELLRLGKRAYIVTGRNSGRASGALGDVESILNSLGIEHLICDEIDNNPDVRQCKEKGIEAGKFGADFIIGIGGGSPLDASKAIAVFAINDISTERLFTYGYDNGILPIIAIPTTSGTGSEVTPWSVMTRSDLQTKRSFGGRDTFPKRAILCPKYTQSLSEDITKNTAMDAFTHCFESLISIKSTPITDSINKYALAVFGDIMDELENNRHDEIRKELMLVSMLGGMTISQTGTTIMHAMGYPLTYFYGIPHGLANSYVMPVYLDALREHRPARLQLVLKALGKSYDELLSYVRRNFTFDIHLSDEEIYLFSTQTSQQGSSASTGIPCTVEDIEELYRKMR